MASARKMPLPARILHRISAATRDKLAPASLRLVEVLNVQIQYACGLLPSRASLGRTSPAFRFESGAISGLVLALLLGVFPLGAVTTASDVRHALEQAASYQPASSQDPISDPELFARLRLLRTRARDFAIGSVVDAARRARSPRQVLEKARGRVESAGLPMRADPAAFGDIFAPSARIEFFEVEGMSPEWIGARVQIGIPCGSDLSLFLWHLRAAEGEETLVPELLFARESPLTRTQEGVATQDYAVRQSAESGALEVATIETSAWCSSFWRTATLAVVRGGSHPYRPERLFQHQEPVFLGEEQQPVVTVGASGFHFRFLTHFWLDLNQHHRLKEIEVGVEGDRAAIQAPRADDPVLFLDQWVAAPWRESRFWTTGRHEQTLRAWHQTLSPETDSRLVTEVVDRGNCRHDPRTAWVHLHARPQGDRGSELFGILRREPNGFRVDEIAEQLPDGCPAATAGP